MRQVQRQLKAECERAEQAFDEQQWKILEVGIDYWLAHDDHMRALSALKKFERIVGHAKSFEERLP